MQKYFPGKSPATSILCRCLLYMALVPFAFPQAMSDVPGYLHATPATHSLSGTVVNSISGEPVRRALVQAGSSAGGNPVSVFTDAEGRFEFASLPESEIVLSVRKPGFFNELELRHSDSSPYDLVHLGADASSVVLKLVPESTIVGHVVSSKGEPIEDSTIRIFQEHIVEGRKRWDLRSQVSTDEDGQFRLANLVPGQYLLVAGPDLPGSFTPVARRSSRLRGYGTTFYPGVPNLQAATPLAITGGQQLQADFSLRSEPLFKVSGTILGVPVGTPVNVQFETQTGEILPATVGVDANEKFQARVPAGAYVLQLRGPAQAGQAQAADLPLVVDADMENLTFALAPEIALPVRVELRHTGAPDVQPYTRSNRQLSSYGLSMVRLISTDKRMQVREFAADRNEKGGALAFHNLAPGRYAVEIAPVPPWYVRSASSGTIDLLREELVISPGHRPEPLEIILRDDSAGLRGTIDADGKPSGGTVLLFSDHMSLEHVQTASAQNGTEFLFSGLAPGDYKVLAFDSVEGLEFKNPEVLGPYLSKAVSVTLQPNDVARVNLERMIRTK
jgi:hypothetical protein